MKTPTRALFDRCFAAEIVASTRAWPLAVCLAGLLVTGTAAAVGGIATDQAVSLIYGPSHWDGSPSANIIGVDPSGSQLSESGWWYRAEGDTREFPLPQPDTETYAAGQIVALWNDLDGKGFRLEERTWVLDSEGPSGGFMSYMSVQNNNLTSKTFALFNYVNVDLGATLTGDSGTLMNPHFLKFSDGTTRASYRAASASHYQVGSFPVLSGLLNDTATTDLNNSGLPFGPGDVSAAYEFGPSLYLPGVNWSAAFVALVFNPPADHVKGDFLGVLPHTPLIAQLPDLTSSMAMTMRRTTQINLSFGLGAPAATASIAGIDDFNGDFFDDLVYRDTVSGVAYVGSTPISGASTLPLNWKLSATGDFNFDGKADILWRNVTSQRLAIWTMNGSAKVGNITPTPDHAVDANWEVAGAADFNGDGKLDLLWYNQTTGRIVLWYMDASVSRLTGLFTTPAAVGDNNWRVVAVGDFGKGPGAGLYNTQDIVWQNDTSHRIVVWHMDLAAQRTGGQFTTPDSLASYLVVGPR